MIFTGTGNANKILGIPVQTGTPSDTFTLLYDAASSRWIFGPSGTPPAGGVGGGANLTTVGSVPFVTSSGVLGQDAGFSYDAVNNRLDIQDPGNAARLIRVSTDGTGAYLFSPASTSLRFIAGNIEAFRLHHATQNMTLGTTTDDGTNRLQVAGSMAGAITSAVSNRDGATSLRLSTSLAATAVPATVGARITFSQRWFNSDSGVIRVGAINGWKTNSDGGFGGGVQLYHQPVADVDLSPTLSTFHTGDVAIGTTTNGNFRLDVASSGSSGTTRIYDQTPTTGSTSLVVRAGAGQTGNLFSVRNASNVEQFWVNSFGPEANNFIAVTRFRTNSNEVGIEATSGLDLASNRLIRYSSTTDYSGTKDLSLSRASANTLQVGDGGSNSDGIILSRRVQSAGETVASLPAAAAGNAGTISYVTDSNSTTIGATVAGGGANKVLVWSNGTAWKIFAN